MSKKSKLNSVMEKIQQENPDATWGNLLTGLGILFLVAAFSISYFGRSPDEVDILGDSKTNQEITKESSSSEDLGIFTTTLNEDTVIVEKGEGLWNVAKRACGDGERYNYLAAANNLSIWSSVSLGQELILDCGPKKSEFNN